VEIQRVQGKLCIFVIVRLGLTIRSRHCCRYSIFQQITCLFRISNYQRVLQYLLEMLVLLFVDHRECHIQYERNYRYTCQHVAAKVGQTHQKTKHLRASLMYRKPQLNANNPRHFPHKNEVFSPRVANAESDVSGERKQYSRHCYLLQSSFSFSPPLPPPSYLTHVLFMPPSRLRSGNKNQKNAMDFPLIYIVAFYTAKTCMRLHGT
jgi:hypothetical protein